jgi:hypothetical protein
MWEPQSPATLRASMACTGITLLLLALGSLNLQHWDKESGACMAYNRDLLTVHHPFCLSEFSCSHYLMSSCHTFSDFSSHATQKPGPKAWSVALVYCYLCLISDVDYSMYLPFITDWLLGNNGKQTCLRSNKSMQNSRGTVRNSGFYGGPFPRSYKRDEVMTELHGKGAAIQWRLEHGSRGIAIVEAVTRQLLVKTFTHSLMELSSSWEAANCGASGTFRHFMEPEGSLPCSQEPSNGPYSEPH